MYIDVDIIIKAAALITAAGVIIGLIAAIVKFIMQPKSQGE